MSLIMLAVICVFIVKNLGEISGQIPQITEQVPDIVSQDALDPFFDVDMVESVDITKSVEVFASTPLRTAVTSTVRCSRCGSSGEPAW